MLRSYPNAIAPFAQPKANDVELQANFTLRELALGINTTYSIYRKVRDAAGFIVTVTVVVVITCPFADALSRV